MKRTFEDWLVVSDVDGTLHNKMRQLPRRNYEAIKTFTELGGNFTLASGRTATNLAEAYASVPCNQPAVVMNGAAIYDMHEKQLVHSDPIGPQGRQFVRYVIRRFSHSMYSVDVAIYCADMVYVVKSGSLSQVTFWFDKSPCTITDIDRVPQEGWLKVVFWGLPHTIEYFSDYVTTIPDIHVHFMLSSPFSIEMLRENAHKGSGVMRLAKDLGIRTDHVAAIGDYYNDWKMLNSVGLPACAGQAPKKIRDVCKFRACHCNQGCVADLLEYIMYRGGGLPIE